MNGRIDTSKESIHNRTHTGARNAWRMLKRCIACPRWLFSDPEIF